MNRYAYTGPEPFYPPYISVNDRPGGTVEVTVRSKRIERDGRIESGPTASIVLTAEQVEELKAKL